MLNTLSLKLKVQKQRKLVHWSHNTEAKGKPPQTV